MRDSGGEASPRPPVVERDRLISTDDQHTVALVVCNCDQHRRLDHRVHVGRDRLDQADCVAQRRLVQNDQAERGCLSLVALAPLLCISVRVLGVVARPRTVR